MTNLYASSLSYLSRICWNLRKSHALLGPVTRRHLSAQVTSSTPTHRCRFNLQVLSVISEIQIPTFPDNYATLELERK